jgi:hypothetical protein
MALKSAKGESMEIDQPVSPDKLWGKIEILSSSLDRFGIRHWYLTAFAPYVLLVIRGLLSDIVGKTFWQETRMEAGDWIFISAPIMLSIIAILFNYWQKSLPRIFQDLIRQNRLITKDGNEFLPTLIKLRDNYKTDLASKWRFIIPVLLALPVLGFAIQSGFLQKVSFRDVEGTLISASILVRWLLGPLWWAYFASMAIWPILLTARLIRRLPRTFDLQIQPSHPDQCGGLKPLGDLCIGIGLPVLLGTFLLGFYGIGGLLFPNTFRSVIVTYANVALVFLAFPLIVTFVWPLWDIHVYMAEKKKHYENEFANQATALETKIKQSLESGNLADAKDAKDRWEVLQMLHPDKLHYPVWPVDRNTIIQILSSQIPPGITLVGNALTWVLTKINEAAK